MSETQKTKSSNDATKAPAPQVVESIRFCGQEYPMLIDEGLMAWLSVLGAFLFQFGVLGLIYTQSVFVVPYTVEFDVGRGGASLVGTICLALWLGAGPFVGPFFDRVGVKWWNAIGMIFFVGGFLLGTLSTEIWHLYLTQGTMVGIGSTFLYLSSITIIRHWFQKKAGMATGLASAGAGFGTFAYAPMIGAMESRYGYQVALLILALASLVTMALANLVTFRRIPLQEKSEQRPVCATLAANLVASCKSHNFRCFMMMTWTYLFGFCTVVTHLAAYAEDQGLDSKSASWMSSALGIGSLLGRVCLGLLSDRITAIRTSQLVMLVTGVTLAVWPLCTIEPTIALFSFMFGFFGTGFWGIMPVMVGDLFGVMNMARILPCAMLFASPVMLASGPLAGLIRDETGTYLVAQVIGAVLAFCSFGALLFMDPEEAKQFNGPQDEQAKQAPAEVPVEIENPMSEVALEIVDGPQTSVAEHVGDWRVCTPCGR